MRCPFKTFNLRCIRLLVHTCRLNGSHRSLSALEVSASSSLTRGRGSCHLQSRLLSTLRPTTFMDVVKAAAKQGSAASDSVAIRDDQKSYSYQQLLSGAVNISRLLSNKELQSSAGNGHLNGARVGIIAKPSAEFVAGMLGTWLSGGVAVPLALSYPEAELLHVLNDSDVSLILSTGDYHDLMQSVAAKSSAKCSLIPSIPSETTGVEKMPLENFQSSHGRCGEDPALIIYTSGTTGKPKGVVHTHKSISAQVHTLSDAWAYASSDQFLHCLPLHHIQQIISKSFIYLFILCIFIVHILDTIILSRNPNFTLTASIHVHGLFNALLAPLYAGSTVEFMPKFSVRGIWQRWRESYHEGKMADDAITVFTGVPTMYTRLIQGYEAMDPDLKAVSASAASNLRLMMCGSSALPYPVMQRWEAITGHWLLERYGMTEFVMAISNPLNEERRAGTVGKPFPGVEAKILKDESGDDALGVGELCIKSPSLFKEYWKLPEVTKGSFIDGGFFKTGDAVRVDEDGYYIIMGRTSADIMKVGGYKLSALEIESVLLEHPAVAECCVLGVEDKDYGELVCAIIVPEEEEKRKHAEESKPAITLDELCTWAKDKLAPYKLPTRMFLWDSLPRNAMGKINKKELKKKLSSEGHMD
ncbi:hypothetical protein SAY87_018217 [Trapa incisa]|uniref:4-coumarate--CoA ligase n=1 Tax=Trapa incisa TaxID=236973 RepID=A0AAN7LAD7_9MYRT|nr:hypothetical protein SAY87_018217 [Trapa incisa]